MSVSVEKCLQAWTNSLKQMDAKADIVFFGDSLTYYGDFASAFPDIVVCNLGLRGDTIQGMIERVEQVRILEPKLVFLMAGINDVSILTAENFEFHYDVLIRCLLNHCRSSMIFIQNLLPVNNKDYTISCNNEQIINRNTIIYKLCKKYGLHYVDLFSLYNNIIGILPSDETIDGIHLVSGAYKKWISILLPIVKIYSNVYIK